MDSPAPELDYIIKNSADITYKYALYVDYYYWRGMLILCVGDVGEATQKTILENRAAMYEILAREDTGRAYVFEARYAMV